MSEKIGFDGPGMQKGLAFLGSLPNDMANFRSQLEAELAQAGPIQTRAGSELDRAIYLVDKSCTEGTTAVLDGVMDVFGGLHDTVGRAGQAKGQAGANAEDAAGTWNGGGGGHH